MICKDEKNIKWHNMSICKTDRQNLNAHKSVVIWFTGLSASGKSTIASKLEYMLYQKKIRTYIIDGDNVRHGLNKDLGFSEKDRKENIRRIGEVCKLFNDAGIMVLSSFISPYVHDRKDVRDLFEEGEFIEVYIRCNINVCAERDPKGLYKKAYNGEIQEFTGVSAPYEEPINPEIIIDSDILTIEESCDKIIEYLLKKELI
ncbi:adenylyl-sulfate kinase [Bacillus thuringiensis]|uniref:adenylyl-sulfate kinase n=1 Tax=Bacillus thuringiensis TaxID=1428 RepID=UPI000BEC074D|nr:adenylyl-sulfate kinase [Bacillus thuringiensis]MED3053028.1 adenylyl-sulfate kinase [Bacillus thuringiensis]PEA16658.1 adenylyl-sulfate kinase [Bacillus thuringiensis]PFH77312.1 adenylyl-sulfate kinase [Bacillus thuringiensis]